MAAMLVIDRVVRELNAAVKQLIVLTLLYICLRGGK